MPRRSDIPNNFSPTPQSRITSTAAGGHVRLQYSDSPDLTSTHSHTTIPVIDLTQPPPTTTPHIPPPPAAGSHPPHTRPPQCYTAGAALKQFAVYMTSYEQSEILQYKHIYYCGQNAQLSHKIHGVPHTADNNGYDDQQHELHMVTGDHLEYRYEIIGLLGRGSFGQVVKVYDHKKQVIVALKVIRNNKKFHAQALTEIKILEHLMAADKQHTQNIVRVYGYFYFRAHLCITFECCYINLYDFLKLNQFNGLTAGLIKRFTAQLVDSLVYLEQQGIIHCDLKPENILLKSSTRSTIKLIDFGSSCYTNDKMFTYIQSRFYRSPEVILGVEYGHAIDMWSLGCILFELHTGYPLFAGESEAEQLMLQMSVLGRPPRDMLMQAERAGYYFDAQTLEPILQPNSRGKIYQVSSRNLKQMLNCTNSNLVDLIEQCLHWSTDARITPAQAQRHPFLRDNAVDAPVAQLTQQLQSTNLSSPPPQQPHTARPSMSLTRQIIETQNSRNNSKNSRVGSQLNVFDDRTNSPTLSSGQRKSLDSGIYDEQTVG